jgi:hypothetical protein
MRIPYGYSRNEIGEININNKQAETVKKIYDFYLQGKSLGGIVEALKSRNILSPTGNSIWTRATVDKVLNNGKYIPSIISEEQFWNAQFERERRTNIDNKGRKIARYNSQNVLSGLLVCGECGCNYRRITRPSGEIVWRCANKVENGKKSACSNIFTLSDEKVKKDICEQLNIDVFEENIIRDNIEKVVVKSSGITIENRSLNPRIKNIENRCNTYNFML